MIRQRLTVGVLAAAACATERGRRSEGRQAHEYLWGQHGIGAAQYEVLVPSPQTT
jgi:hypothetical protein